LGHCAVKGFTPFQLRVAQVVRGFSWVFSVLLPMLSRIASAIKFLLSPYEGETAFD